MPTVVNVHGIVLRNKAPELLAADWGPPVCDGAGRSGKELGDRDLVCAFDGRLFRPPGPVRALAAGQLSSVDG